MSQNGAKPIRHFPKVMGKPEVVTAEPLGSILRKFCEDWKRERPTGYDAAGKSRAYRNSPVQVSSYTYISPDEEIEVEPSFFGPEAWISEKTGINVRSIRGIRNGEYPYVPFEKVDAILQALNLTHYLYNGEIEVIRNPKWSVEAWQEYMADRGCV